MTAAATGSAKLACTDCEVTWRGPEQTCWSCGRPGSTTAAALEDTLRPDAATVTPTTAGKPLTRWGHTYQQAHALGLPDPRAPRRDPNAPRI